MDTTELFIATIYNHFKSKQNKIPNIHIDWT